MITLTGARKGFELKMFSVKIYYFVGFDFKKWFLFPGTAGQKLTLIISGTDYVL